MTKYCITWGEAHIIVSAYNKEEDIYHIRDLENLMPACRTCNHYKRANPLELFRRYIQEIPQKLRKNYIYKVGLKYGNVIENEKPIKFHFEKVGDGEV